MWYEWEQNNKVFTLNRDYYFANSLHHNLVDYNSSWNPKNPSYAHPIKRVKIVGELAATKYNKVASGCPVKHEVIQNKQFPIVGRSLTN